MKGGRGRTAQVRGPKRVSLAEDESPDSEQGQMGEKHKKRRQVQLVALGDSLGTGGKEAKEPEGNLRVMSWGRDGYVSIILSPNVRNSPWAKW